MCIKEVAEYYKLVLNTLMHDQLSDVISYFACSCSIGKICVHDKILIENLQKKRKDGD